MIAVKSPKLWCLGSILIMVINSGCKRRSLDFIEDPVSPTNVQEPETEESNEVLPVDQKDPTSEMKPEDKVEADPNCLNITNYDYTQTGPFQVSASQQGAVNTYVPSNLPSGCKAPMVHFNNGTGATCAYYDNINRHLASYGFLVACYESTNTGSGEQCITAIESLYNSNKNIADIGKIGTTGHSQGGSAALTCLYLAENKWPNSKFAAHAIEPAHGMNRNTWQGEYPQIKSPVFMFSGSDDNLVSSDWVGWGYGLLNSEAVWFEAEGATHFNPHGWAMSSSVAWFRWKLLGDEQAGATLMGYPNNRFWNAVASKN